MLPRAPSTAPSGFHRLAARLASADPGYPHAILYFLRDPVIAHDRPRVMQAAAFALDDKAPQCLACFGDQFSTRRIGDLAVAIVLRQGRESGFERAAGAAKRQSLFLRYFIIERVGDRCGTAAEGDHVEADIIAAEDFVSAPGDQRSQVTTETPAAGSRSRCGPGLRPWRARTSSGVAFGPTSSKTGNPPGILACAARER